MTEPVPVPKNILRGHKAQIHAAVFLRNNERLATGDAEGFVVLWDLTIMRPRAVWQPHEKAILGITGWGQTKVITHGRDHKLIVWQIGPEDEGRLSTSLPLEAVSTRRPQPWMLHLLEVNTMNFCPFAACPGTIAEEGYRLDNADEIKIAVPNTLASDAIDIYSLPSQTRIHTIRAGRDTGMAMSLALLNRKGALTLIAAFENGFTSVHRLEANGQWTMTYRTQAHTQPILSLDVHPSLDYCLTSSVDDIIAKHPIPTAQQETIPDFDPNNRIIEEVDIAPGARSSLLTSQLKEHETSRGVRQTTLKEWVYTTKTVSTKHAGQQSLRIRSDGRIFATAGWDSKIRVYSCKTMKELAVLQWHKVGCYAVALASVSAPDATSGSGQTPVSVVHESQRESKTLATKGGDGMSVKDRRIHQAKNAHWIAAGAKDGKISLWDIY